MVFAIGGFVFAAIPQPDGTIVACYKKPIQVHAPSAGLMLTDCATDSAIVYITDNTSNERDGEFYVSFE